MNGFVLVRCRVRDFVAWKEGYDRDAAARFRAGLVEQRLLRGIREPNDITVLYEAQDIERAQAWAASAAQREAMRQGGVIDTPEIHFLDL
jgi:hypothetical protein